MMEKSDSGEAHDHIVLVACLDDHIVPLGSAGLCDVLYTALTSSLDIVSEGEECIGATNNICIFSKPCLLFLSCKYGRLLSEDGLPGTLGKNILILIADVEVDSIVTVSSLDGVEELETEDLGALAKEPVVSLASGKPGAVDSGLLSRSDTDSLSVLYITHGI